MAKVATWKSGFGQMYKADANKVAEEIMSIGSEATPEQIVALAENNETELHKCFTWDDSEAARKYRLHEARQIVCHLVIKEEPEKKQPQVRYFFKTDVQRNSGYKPTEIIMQNDDEYKKLLHVAYGELRAFRNKYATLKELAPLFMMIDEITA